MASIIDCSVLVDKGIDSTFSAGWSVNDKSEHGNFAFLGSWLVAADEGLGVEQSDRVPLEGLPIGVSFSEVGIFTGTQEVFLAISDLF